MRKGISREIGYGCGLVEEWIAVIRCKSILRFWIMQALQEFFLSASAKALILAYTYDKKIYRLVAAAGCRHRFPRHWYSRVHRSAEQLYEAGEVHRHLAPGQWRYPADPHYTEHKVSQRTNMDADGEHHPSVLRHPVPVQPPARFYRPTL